MIEVIIIWRFSERYIYGGIYFIFKRLLLGCILEGWPSEKEQLSQPGGKNLENYQLILG